MIKKKSVAFTLVFLNMILIGTYIEEESAVLLCESLKMNTTLTELDMGGKTNDHLQNNP